MDSQVPLAHIESQRDSGLQPKVARHEREKRSFAETINAPTASAQGFFFLSPWSFFSSLPPALVFFAIT